MQNTVNSSAVGTGKQYRLLLERVSNDRTLHLAEVAPKDIIDEDNINEEHSYQTATYHMNVKKLQLRLTMVQLSYQ